MTNDYYVLLKHAVELSVNLRNGEEINFYIDLNMRTGDYLRVIAETEQLTQQESDIARINNLCNAVFFIIKNSNRKITPQWIADNITITDQQEILLQVTNEIYKLLSKQELQVPDIKVKRKTGNKDESEKTREEIHKIYALLEGRIKSNILDDVAILMTKTHNSYEQIMRMPILVFRDLVKIISINEFKNNDDWHLAYLKQLESEARKELQNEAITSSMPKQVIKADLKRLKQML